LSELLRPALEKSAIQWRTDFAYDPELSLDSNQIKQALLNLVNNSSQAIGREGIITLRTRPAWVRRLRRRCAGVAIEVQDTGKGISPETQKRIFDPFFTTRDEGTGLGLPITARIVHSHHGLIECESQPGRGALFRILLPLSS
jgi:two-component system nitrogen regulation sensor histidine kinase GlnL